jgi:hypothetical protein
VLEQEAAPWPAVTTKIEELPESRPATAAFSTGGTAVRR